jgi:transposase InsO family protein
VPLETRRLIARLARENPLWGEEAIASHLLLKLGLRLSPRTVHRYMPKPPRSGPWGDLRWSTFIRNHAQALVACDFFTAVTATFQVLYVFVLMEVGSRRILHINVTAHPTAGWTRQQLRHAIPCEHPYRFLLHDRDSIYSAAVDATLANLGVRVVRTPVRAPRANAFCERAIGTLRRECLDWIIPLGEAHLRRLLRQWRSYYNQARPHSALGPGLPEPRPGLPAPLQAHRHRLPPGSRALATPVLGGLHHDYRLELAA